ncbi:MAG: hypothetical protein R3C10_22655 [Pirellulales bacterium]
MAVWLAWHVHLARRQQQAVAAIREYGGWVRYDYQFPSGAFSYKNFDPKAESAVPRWVLDQLGPDVFHDVVQVSLNYSEDSGTREVNGNSSDDALQHLPKLPDLRVLLLSETQASDESMRYLAQLPRLEHLYMWDVHQVSDAGVEHLRKLKNLRSVHIGHSQITDKSVDILTRCPKIESLSLQGHRFTDRTFEYASRRPNLKSLVVGLGSVTFTDDGLAHLEGLTELERLGIQQGQITDSGVIHLVKLAKLKDLWISGNQLTDVGEAELKRANPALKVLR